MRIDASNFRSRDAASEAKLEQMADKVLKLFDKQSQGEQLFSPLAESISSGLMELYGSDKATFGRLSFHFGFKCKEPMLAAVLARFQITQNPGDEYAIISYGWGVVQTLEQFLYNQNKSGAEKSSRIDFAQQLENVATLLGKYLRYVVANNLMLAHESKLLLRITESLIRARQEAIINEILQSVLVDYLKLAEPEKCLDNKTLARIIKSRESLPLQKAVVEAPGKMIWLVSLLRNSEKISASLELARYLHYNGIETDDAIVQYGWSLFAEIKELQGKQGDGQREMLQNQLIALAEEAKNLKLPLTTDGERVGDFLRHYQVKYLKSEDHLADDYYKFKEQYVEQPDNVEVVRQYGWTLRSCISQAIEVLQDRRLVKLFTEEFEKLDFTPLESRGDQLSKSDKNLISSRKDIIEKANVFLSDLGNVQQAIYKRDYATAIHGAEKYLSVYPDSNEAKLILAQANSHIKKYESALQNWGAVVDKAPDLLNAQHHTSICWDITHYMKVLQDIKAKEKLDIPEIKKILALSLSLDKLMRPSLPYSLLLRRATDAALMAIEDGKAGKGEAFSFAHYYIDFVNRWDLSNLQNEDYERYQPQPLKQYPSLCEKVVSTLYKVVRFLAERDRARSWSNTNILINTNLNKETETAQTMHPIDTTGSNKPCDVPENKTLRSANLSGGIVINMNPAVETGPPVVSEEIAASNSVLSEETLDNYSDITDFNTNIMDDPYDFEGRTNLLDVHYDFEGRTNLLDAHHDFSDSTNLLTQKPRRYEDNLLKTNHQERAALVETVPFDKLALSVATMIKPYIERYPDQIWHPFYYGKLLIWGGSMADARDYFLKVTRVKTSEFWVWSTLAETYPEGDEMRQALLARALLCRVKERSFLVNVHEQLGQELRKSGKDSAALHEFECSDRLRKEKQWKVARRSSDFYSWSKKIVATESNHKLYKELATKADDLVFTTLPQSNGVLESRFKDQKRDDEEFAIVGWFCEAGYISSRVATKRHKQLDKLAPGAPLTLFIDDQQDRPRVLKIETRHEGVPWDCYPTTIAVVESVDFERKTTRVAYGYEKYALMRHDRLPDADKLQPGVFIKIGLPQRRPERALPTALFAIELSVSQELDFTRNFQGRLKRMDGRDFAFVDDIFIGIHLLKHHPGLESGTDVAGVALKALNRTKQQPGWRALTLRVL